MTIFRNIVERSSMVNNDEQIFYTEAQLTEVRKGKNASAFDHTRLVISRPVFQEEIDAGLNLKWQGRTWDDDAPKNPKITDALDDFFKLKGQIDPLMEFGIELPKIINEIIAYNFYDCMSGGVGIYFLSACRWFIETNNIPLDEEVYPAPENKGHGPKGWYTLQQFLKEIEDVPRIEEMLTQIPGAKKIFALPNNNKD